MQLYDSLWKQQSSWRCLKNLCAECQQNTEIWCSFTYCLRSESWPGSFIAGFAPSFSIKPCANPAPNLALFIKHSWPKLREQIKHLWTSVAALEKQTASTVHVTLGSLGSCIFPSHPKTHSFRDIFLEQVLCSAADDVEGHACSSGRNAHTRNSSLHDVMKGHAGKKTFRNLYEPGRSAFDTELLRHLIFYFIFYFGHV